VYLKINNPEQAQNSSQLIHSAGFLALFLAIFVVICMLCGGNLTTFIPTVIKFFTELIKKEPVEGVGMVLFVVILVPLAFSQLIDALKKRKNPADPALVQGIDFQAERFTLLREKPVVLSYKETSFKMVIRMETVTNGKNGSWPKVTQLTFYITATPEGAETPVQLTIEHKATLKDIFPLLTYKPLFKEFFYEFDLELMNDLSKEDRRLIQYRDFVEEQIENKLKGFPYLLLTKREYYLRLYSCGIALFLCAQLLWLLLVISNVWMKIFLFCAVGGIAVLVYYFARPIWEYRSVKKALQKYTIKETFNKFNEK